MQIAAVRAWFVGRSCTTLEPAGGRCASPRDGLRDQHANLPTALPECPAKDTQLSEEGRLTAQAEDLAERAAIIAESLPDTLEAQVWAERLAAELVGRRSRGDFTP